MNPNKSIVMFVWSADLEASRLVNGKLSATCVRKVERLLKEAV